MANNATNKVHISWVRCGLYLLFSFSYMLLPSGPCSGVPSNAARRSSRGGWTINMSCKNVYR